VATFVDKPLGGAGFFETVRTTMTNTGEWLFAGSDGALRYVVMDALFYGMETIIRPDGSANADYNPDHLAAAQKFMDYAENLTTQSTTNPRFRVVVNGNFYDNGDFNYFKAGPNHWWKGEVYKAGRFINPPAKSADAKPLSDLSFIGRSGQRIERYQCEEMTPSEFKTLHPGSAPTYAMGGVKRIIKDKMTPPGLDTTEHRWRGKTIVGFHKTTGSIFVVTQEDVKSLVGNLTSIVLFGKNLADITKCLTDAGVDAAVKCDGGTSSALIVDGEGVVPCEQIQRDCSTPNGLAFKFANIQLGGQGTQAMISHGPQTVSNFNASIAVEPIVGKLVLTITSLGSTTSDGDIASSLSIQLSPIFPLILKAPLGSDLRNGATFNSVSSSPNSVECFAGLHGDPNVDAIAATVKVMQGTSVLKTGSFIWPILA
jgi:Phosphodiester glycosidase